MEEDDSIFLSVGSCERFRHLISVYSSVRKKGEKLSHFFLHSYIYI